MRPTVDVVIDYTTPGPLTSLAGIPTAALLGVAVEPVAICRPVHGLVLQPDDAKALGVAVERFEENQIRPAARLVEVLLVLDPAPLSEPREPGRRVVGTCRRDRLQDARLSLGWPASTPHDSLHIMENDCVYAYVHAAGQRSLAWSASELIAPTISTRHGGRHSQRIDP